MIRCRIEFSTPAKYGDIFVETLGIPRARKKHIIDINQRRLCEHKLQISQKCGFLTNVIGHQNRDLHHDNRGCIFLWAFGIPVKMNTLLVINSHF